MTTKNEETLLGIEKCSDLLLDKSKSFLLNLAATRKNIELWSQLAINDFGKNYPLFRIIKALSKKIHIFTSKNK